MSGETTIKSYNFASMELHCTETVITLPVG